MKLLGFIAVSLGSILAYSAAVPDTSDAPTNLVERGDVRCKKSDECHRWGMWCVKGICRHLNHPFPPRDESSADPMPGPDELEGGKCDSDRNCPKSHKCIRGQCRNGPNTVSADPETPLNPEGSDVKIWCQKDSDCGNGMCLENACVDAAINDYDNDSDDDDGEMHIMAGGDPDDDKEMHIEARRQKCREDKDCPKGKSCMWNACRAPVKLHYRRDDPGNPDGIIADPNDNDIGIDDPIMHIMNSELYSDAASDIETHDLESRERKKCKDCRPGQICRRGHCIDRKCGDGPPCQIGMCKNGKCTGIARRSTDVDAQDSDEPGLPYDNLADNENTDDDDDDASAESLEARAVGKDCSNFKDCEAGEACKRKTCTPRKCRDAGGCRSGTCKGGKCTRSLGFRTTDLEEPDEFGDVLTCETTDDCTSGDCQNGLCFSGPETFERRGKYPPRCQSANDCPPQNRCYGGICKYRPRKRDEGSEESEVERDEEDILEPELEVLAGKYPPRCKSTNTCPPKQRCYGGICKYRGPEKRDEDPEIEWRRRCKTIHDCPPNHTCYGRVCKYYKPPVKRDDEDISEPELEARSPKPPKRCSNNDDCDNWLQCHKGICKFRPPRYGGR